MSQYDAIIIGAGPAGSVAATKLAQQNRKVLLLDKGIEHGYLGSLRTVPFFPGFSESSSGKQIVANMHEQAKSFGAETCEAEVSEVDFTDQYLKLSTTNNDNYLSKSIILASGAAQKTNYVDGEKEWFGSGAFHCSHTYGFVAKGKDVVALGKSENTAKDVIQLSKIARKVNFVIPSSKLDAPDHLINELERSDNVELFFSTSVKSVNGDDRVKSVALLAAGNEKELSCDAFFNCLSDYQRINDFLLSTVKVSDNAEVFVDEHMATSVKGVFACGDILCGRPQQPTVSAAQGMIAGINVDIYLGELA